MFKRELGAAGFVEGKNLVYRSFVADENQLSRDLEVMLAEKPDVVIVSTTPHALAMQKATSVVPVVFVAVTDPEGSGLVRTLARPGGNLTGVSDFGVEVVEKSLQLIREIVAGTKSVAVLVSDSPVHPRQVKAIEAAARPLAVSVASYTAITTQDFEAAFARIAKDRANFIIVLGGNRHAAQRERIADLATRIKVPTIAPHERYVEAGGLMSFGPSVDYQYGLAVGSVIKILTGVKPADIAVQQPGEVEITFNRATATALGIRIPEQLLIRAHKVFN